MGCLASVQVFPDRELKDHNEMKRGSQFSSYTTSSITGSHLRHNIKLPLTEKEVFAISKSWKAISRNMTNTGIAMFLRMFNTRPDVKSMFEQFRSVEKADLGNSRSLENHALLVMNALDESIANMDDPAYLIEMLLVTGKSHRRFEDFNEDIFWAIEEPFITAVRQTLNDRFSPSMEKIYRKTILFVLTTLITGFKHDFPTEDEAQKSAVTSFAS